MATLSELAKTQQSTRVGEAINVNVGGQQGTSIQATGVVDKSAALAEDIGKMFGGLVKEHQQASEYAGKRVGTDNLVEYKKQMSQIEEYYNRPNVTSSEMVEKGIREQGIYEHYMQKGHFGDNDLANQAFRDTYADPAGIDVLSKKATNRKRQGLLFRNEEKIAIGEEIDALDGTLSQSVIDTYKSRFKLVGLDENEIDNMIIASRAGRMEAFIRENQTAFVNRDGSQVEDSIQDYASHFFGMYRGSEDSAIQKSISTAMENGKNFLKKNAVEMENDFNAKVMTFTKTRLSKNVSKRDQNGVLYTFDTTPKQYMEAMINEFPELGYNSQHNRELIQKIVNAYDKAHGSKSGEYASIVEYDLDTAELDTYLSNNKTPPKELVDKTNIFASNSKSMNISTSDKEKIITKQAANKRKLDVLNTVTNDVNAYMDSKDEWGSTQTLDYKMKNGYETPSGSVIAGSVVQDKVKEAVGNLEVFTNAHKLSEEDKDGNNVGRVIFAKNIERLDNLTTSVTGEPPIFKHYRSSLTNPVENFTSVDDAKKSMMFYKMKARGDQSLTYTVNKTDELLSILDKDFVNEKGEPLEGNALESARLSEFNSSREAFIQNKFIKGDYEAVAKNVRKMMPLLESGSLEYFTALNAEANAGLRPELYDWAIATGNYQLSEESFADKVGDLNIAHWGRNWPAITTEQDKVIIMNPNDNESSIKKAMDTMLDKHEGYSYKNVVVVSKYGKYTDASGKEKTGWYQQVNTDRGFKLFSVTPATAEGTNTKKKGITSTEVKLPSMSTL